MQILCCVRAGGAVRPSQRGGGRADETPGGDPQAGATNQPTNFLIKPTQVRFEDLFLVQCFHLCYLDCKRRLLSLLGRQVSVAV